MYKTLIVNGNPVNIDPALVQEFEAATCDNYESYANNWLAAFQEDYPQLTFNECVQKLSAMMHEEISLAKGEI